MLKRERERMGAIINIRKFSVHFRFSAIYMYICILNTSSNRLGPGQFVRNNAYFRKSTTTGVAIMTIVSTFFTVSKTCLSLPWCRRWLTFDLFARSAARVHYHSPQSSLHWPRHVVSDLDATTKHLAVTHQGLLIEKRVYR